MRGEDSYAALGLRPGAGRAEVDEAYRRLIKRHHPDRNGGDGSRAAEINRAYSQIRRGAGLQVARPRTVPVVMQPPRRAPSRRGRWLFLLAVAAVAGIAFAGDNLGQSPHRPLSRLAVRWDSPPLRERIGFAVPMASFDEPLQVAVVDRAIAEAIKFHGDGDLGGAAAYSRDCRDKIRERPSIAWFDTCAAFDEAMLTLSDDNPNVDSSPFSSLAVMGRELAAARALSADAMGADSRVHQIRLRVEMVLLPRFDEPAQPAP